MKSGPASVTLSTWLICSSWLWAGPTVPKFVSQPSSLQSGITIIGETVGSRTSIAGQSVQNGASTPGRPGTSDGIGRKVRGKGGSKQERGYKSTPTRAASASHGSAQRAPGQLHRYAGKTHHVGIPDRIERIHPSSLKLAIEGPHTDQTNAGYSRKEDGTFYGV